MSENLVFWIIFCILNGNFQTSWSSCFLLNDNLECLFIILSGSIRNIFKYFFFLKLFWVLFYKYKSQVVFKINWVRQKELLPRLACHLDLAGTPVAYGTIVPSSDIQISLTIWGNRANTITWNLFTWPKKCNEKDFHSFFSGFSPTSNPPDSLGSGHLKIFFSCFSKGWLRSCTLYSYEIVRCHLLPFFCLGTGLRPMVQCSRMSFDKSVINSFSSSS